MCYMPSTHSFGCDSQVVPRYCPCALLPSPGDEDTLLGTCLSDGSPCTLQSTPLCQRNIQYGTATVQIQPNLGSFMSAGPCHVSHPISEPPHSGQRLQSIPIGPVNNATPEHPSSNIAPSTIARCDGHIVPDGALEPLGSPAPQRPFTKQRSMSPFDFEPQPLNDSIAFECDEDTSNLLGNDDLPGCTPERARGLGVHGEKTHHHGAGQPTHSLDEHCFPNGREDYSEFDEFAEPDACLPLAFSDTLTASAANFHRESNGKTMVCNC